MSQNEDQSGTVFNSGLDNPEDLKQGYQLFPTDPTATQNSLVTLDVQETNDLHPRPPTTTGLSASPTVSTIYSEHITRVKPQSVGTTAELHKLSSAPCNALGVLQNGSLVTGRSSDSGAIANETAGDSEIRNQLPTAQGALGNKSQVADSNSDYAELKELLESPTVAEKAGCRSEVTEVKLLSSPPLANMSRIVTRSAANMSQHDESSISESTKDIEDDILEFVSEHSQNSAHSPISPDSTVEEIKRFLFESMDTASQTGPSVTPTILKDVRYQPYTVVSGDVARTASQTGQPVTPTISRDVRGVPRGQQQELRARKASDSLDNYEIKPESADDISGQQQELGIVRNAPVTFYTYEMSPESSDCSTSQQNELGRLRKTYVTLDAFDTGFESASFSGSQEQVLEIVGEASVTLNTPESTPDTAGSSGGEQETSEAEEASLTSEVPEASASGGG